MKSHLELVINPRKHAADGPGPDMVRNAQGECKRDDAWRHGRIAIAAYYLAEHRGFQPGSEGADWAVAERQIDAADAIGG